MLHAAWLRFVVKYVCGIRAPRSGLGFYDRSIDEWLNAVDLQFAEDGGFDALYWCVICAPIRVVPGFGAPAGGCPVRMCGGRIHR
jgi:hypothetical protein